MNELLITVISSAPTLDAILGKPCKELIQLLMWNDGLLSSLRGFFNSKEFLLMRLAFVTRFESVKASDCFGRMTVYHRGQVSHQRSYHVWVKTGRVYFFSGGNFYCGLTG